MYINLKPWQLFLLLFSFAIIEGMIPLAQYDSVHRWLNFSSRIVCLHWVYVTSSHLNDKVSFTTKRSWRFFKINYLYALIWIVFILVSYRLKHNDFVAFGILLNPIHLYGTFCLLYFFWFMSKSLTSIEANKLTTGKEIQNTFFLFLFLPIGVWWLQPRIRKALS